MGFYFRKSKSLPGGLRLNFSKHGIGISGGVKGARVSVGPNGTNFYGSIPGTGLYYRKRISGSYNSNRSYRNTSAGGSYSRTIVNDYTGETRTVRANSQWELDELVRNEELRMETNEMRARCNAEIQSQQEQAEYLTIQARNTTEELKHLISATLSIDDRLNWDEQIYSAIFPDFEYDENSMNVDKETALNEYLEEKDEFEKEQREHNADVNFLRNNFEYGEKSAIEKYASIVLANSKYPTDLEIDFDVEYNGMAAALIVSILFPTFEQFPKIDRFVYENGRDITPVEMSKAQATSLYENTLLAVGLRTLHELFEALYNGAVTQILVVGCVSEEDCSNNIDYEENVRKLFKIKTDAETFNGLTLTDDNVKDAIDLLDFSRVSDFTNCDERL